MAHDSKINDAQDGYLRIRDRAEKVPNLAYALMGAHALMIAYTPMDPLRLAGRPKVSWYPRACRCVPGAYHCAPG